MYRDNLGELYLTMYHRKTIDIQITSVIKKNNIITLTLHVLLIDIKVLKQKVFNLKLTYSN